MIRAYSCENLLLTSRSYLQQRIPSFFHLRTPWQPISINCTLHISKTFVINIVAVISNLYVLTVNKLPFPTIIHFFRLPLSVLVGTPGGTPTPG
jgi:hypothetical protein